MTTMSTIISSFFGTTSSSGSSIKTTTPTKSTTPTPMPTKVVVNRKAQQQFQSRLLDTFTTFVVLYTIYNNPSLINPWNITTWYEWCAGGLLIKAALVVYDYLIFWLVETALGHALLPTRRTTPNTKPVRFVPLDTTSYIYLTINAVHEWIFVQRICYYIWYNPKVSLQLNDIGIINTIGAIWWMFIIMDIIYAPIHHLLHMPTIYPLIHKHHHRQHYPTRGYLDAGNEHPIEHMVGVLCNWAAVLSAVELLQAHAIVVFLFFNLHAALAMLNHSPYDVNFTIIPFGILDYSVGSHEMHHRKFTVNYGQYSMIYDYWMKTYCPYEGPTSTTITTKETTAAAATVKESDVVKKRS